MALISFDYPFMDEFLYIFNELQKYTLPVFSLNQYIKISMSRKLYEYKIVNYPPTLYYIPNYISEHAEAEILKKVYEAPKPKWTHLKNRRLQDYGGVPHPKGMIVESIPSWLQTHVDGVNNLEPFEVHKCNHVLINEYQAGQGILAHFDGPLFHPVIVTISCGSHTVLELFEEESRNDIMRILLEPRSLVILQDDLYTKYMHSIEETDQDVVDEHFVNLRSCGKEYKIGDKLKRSTRVSLTIRNVPKVLNIKLNKLFKKN